MAWNRVPRVYCHVPTFSNGCSPAKAEQGAEIRQHVVRLTLVGTGT